MSAGRRAGLFPLLLVAAALAQPAAASAPDLEIVALQTTGPGRAGDCNAVVARVRNAGDVATAAPPSVRLDVTGTSLWSRTARASAPLPPGDTVEVWFESVPLEGGRLSQIEATADPDGDERESSEDNNARRVARDPQLVCGAPDPPADAALELRVVVVGRGGAGAAGVEPATPAELATPIASAEITVTSPLGVGVVLATATTAADGHATLTVPAGARSPVLKVTARAPGCPPAVRLATPLPGTGAPLEVPIELDCDAGAGSGDAASAPGGVAAPGSVAAPAGAAPGGLEIEAALPGRLRIDDEPARTVTFGSRIELRRPGASVRVRAESANGTVFHDATHEMPRDHRHTVVVDAPPLVAWPSAPATAVPSIGEPAGGKPRADELAVATTTPDAIVEDLRSGLLWTLGTPAAASFAEGAAICDQLDRGGAADWRLPEIDELAFVLEARSRSAAGAPLADLPSCCVWSTTEHAGLRLTFYLDGDHLYGRRAEESGLAALCVRGAAYPVDPLLVPERYHDRLPGRRSFRPRE